jgi:hypothetical protein
VTVPITVSGVMNARNSGAVRPLYEYQTLVKSQLGLRLPFALVAEVKFADCWMCARVMPTPPALVLLEVESVAQKLPVTTVPE